MTLRKRKSSFMEYVWIVIGTGLMGLAVNIVYEPMNMVTGGVSGLAIVIKEFTGNIVRGGIPIWFSNFCINIPLFIVAVRIKGKKFVLKTMFATLSFTLALYAIPVLNVASGDYLLAAVFGGITSGVGLGLVFSVRASTGGTDLFGSILQMYVKHFSIPQLLMIVDSIIVLIGALAFGVNKALYAVIAVFIASKVMDAIMEGSKFGKLVYIISEQEEKIAKEILNSVNRGVTALPAIGMYSGKERRMLFCVVSKKEIVKVREIVGKIDSSAFLIISDVREVMGEGFIEYIQ